MTDGEVDADAFPEGTATARTGPAEVPREAPPPITDLPIPAGGFVYASKSGGRGHLVHVTATGTLACTCEAGEFGRDCWAMKATRAHAREEQP